MPFGVPAFITGSFLNRVIGRSGGIGNTGNNVFIVGAGAGDANSADDVIFIGGSAGLNNTAVGAIAIGTLAGRDNIGANIVAIGDAALDQNVGVGAIGIGEDAGLNNASDGLIAIGERAAGAGLLAGDVTGLIAIGRDAAGLVTQTHVNGDIVVIGFRALDAYPGNSFFRFNTIIGADALSALSAGALQNTVVIGSQAGLGPTDNTSNSVFVGARIATAGTTGGSSNTSVGDQSMEDLTTGVGNTAVGQGALESAGPDTDNIGVGVNAGASVNGDSNCIVGSASAGNAQDSNTILGCNTATATSNNDAVFIGQGIVPPTGTRNIIIGKGAGIGHTWPQTDDTFAVEVRDTAGTTTLGVLYGELDNGNVAIGMNTDGGGDPIDRDFSGTNICKILDGTAPSANPTGGGFLYVTSGALNYRGSGGTITALAAA